MPRRASPATAAHHVQQPGRHSFAQNKGGGSCALRLIICIKVFFFIAGKHSILELSCAVPSTFSSVGRSPNRWHCSHEALSLGLQLFR